MLTHTHTYTRQFSNLAFSPHSLTSFIFCSSAHEYFNIDNLFDFLNNVNHVDKLFNTKNPFKMRRETTNFNLCRHLSSLAHVRHAYIKQKLVIVSIPYFLGKTMRSVKLKETTLSTIKGILFNIFVYVVECMYKAFL